MLYVYYFLFSAILPCVSSAQPCKTDAKVISSITAFRDSARNNPAMKLVDLQQWIPGIVIDMPYATANNFTHTILYYHPAAWMHEAPANALRLVQDDLRKKGLGLKIYDAFRPFSVTCILWRKVSDRHYAANPRKGSYHNRGLAADLTIIYLQTGKELDMGTGYDNFTDSAHHDFTQLPPQVLANRRLLKQTMCRHGFSAVPTEWWHYHWHSKIDYPVIDLDFDEIRKAN